MAGNKSTALSNLTVDGFLRGGALNTSGTLNSSAVAQAAWAATTAFTLGQVVTPPSTFTAGGGKLLLCTTAGTTGSTTTLAVPNPGATLTDGSVTWTAISTMPAFNQFWCALFMATAGQSPRSTSVTTGQTTVPATPNGHLYRCTTGGTTGSGEPTWGTTSGGTTTDGGAVWTEMTPDLLGNTAQLIAVECSGTGYARVSVPSTMAEWAGTQGAGTTVASSGSGGATSNNVAITFGSPTSNWGLVAAMGFYTTSASGTLFYWDMLTLPQTVSNGATAPSFAIAALTVTET